MSQDKPIVAAIIPCYKVKEKVSGVLQRVPADISHIICVDDACPQGSGVFIRETCKDPRVHVLMHEQNQGVGGAMITGYKAALALDADIIVKIDGDGQMAPEIAPQFIAPVARGLCDYAKGNRFYNPEDVQAMPALRLFGNGVLSFLTKLSSGYWGMFDPTNGYTAIHARVLKKIPFDKLSRGYFFESDFLFRLNILRATVTDIPMKAVYEDEISSINIGAIVMPFLKGHLRNFAKRVIYSYFLRDFNIASLELVLGLVFMLFGAVYGLSHWHVHGGTPASAGTVMLSALPVILGFQMLLSFLQFDIQLTPRVPLHPSLPDE